MANRWGLIDDALTSDELDGLALAARDERASALGQILSQDVEFISDFMAVLGITPGSHPQTYRVLHIGSLIASYAVLYYKGLRDRPRPSQIAPALMPPIPVPGHASWPSGHATQAWLIRLCIERIMNGTVSAADEAAVASNVRTLAIRIGRNREIAGLHYPSDSDDGRRLAETIFPFLTGMAAGSRFATAITAARGEWT
jgi:membrane-associated phospholipid phosphatase